MIDAIDALDCGALFSSCRRFRYLLWRRWDRSGGICAFIGLNPSTADETTDDPTIRRCVRFAREWGYGSLWMLNAYAYRATDPKVMQAQGTNALGPLNNEYIRQSATYCERLVAAWGVHCANERQLEIFRLLASVDKPLYALGLTKDQEHPRHPLYMRADTQPEIWMAPLGGIPVVARDDLPDVPYIFGRWADGQQGR